MVLCGAATPARLDFSSAAGTVIWVFLSLAVRSNKPFHVVTGGGANWVFGAARQFVAGGFTDSPAAVGEAVSDEDVDDKLDDESGDKEDSGAVIASKSASGVLLLALLSGASWLGISSSLSTSMESDLFRFLPAVDWSSV